MFAAKSARRALALGSALVTTGVLALVSTPQPAMASGITVQATVDCSNVNFFGDTSDWYATDLWLAGIPSGGGSVPYSSATAVPATHSWRFTQTVPSGTTAVGAGGICSGGHQYDFFGSSAYASIPPGTTTVIGTWACTTAPVYPGPWQTNCTVQSVSYS
ncbi:hypothetical protein DI270_026790 [Microbispora triticiradicis]|uniref:Secreted protein n=3 Tax=Microbispora TaxID=2005 RepID=A0ABY3LU00_9ACTN|nr:MULTISPECIES: hypothetical protein [Microbispora]RGA01971.1 hypothetical protein DI270_026790 [Microbispora triticiradicis]TLP60584.1 hypothetical protein FED44_11760 [Microbispora fusca]TYB54602.1 hypothetical protein FXF59_22150 [Microbispora tritici]GLW20930.1 hypothetical protein Mame01_09730 [Microbispora amethystogenes]